MMRALKGSYAGLVYAFLYLPLLLVALFSFNSSKYSLAWKGFTLEWYSRLWHNTALMTAAVNSLVLAACTATLATILGTVAAFILHRYRFPGRKVLFGTLFVMMMSPDIVIAISLLLLFLALHLPLGFPTLLAAHVVLCVPFVATTVYSRFHGFQDDIIDAARDLGAGEYMVFRRIVLPFAASSCPSPHRPWPVAGCSVSPCRSTTSSSASSPPDPTSRCCPCGSTPWSGSASSLTSTPCAWS